MISRHIVRSFSLAAGFALVAAAGASAQDPKVLEAGTDAWATPGDGSTHALLNLPAGFFCENGKAYSETVVLKGVPVATAPEGAFGNADTLVERTQDAVFDGKGEASVSIVVRALHFAGVDVLKTDCGDFTADVRLASKESGETQMKITSDGEKGGTFSADISVRTTWSFRSADGRVNRSLTTNNVLTSGTPSPWTAQTCDGAARAAGPVTVDSNGDGRVDSRDRQVAGTSRGFLPGYTGDCRPIVLCRGKVLDPALHCYGAAQAVSTTTTSSF